MKKFVSSVLRVLSSEVLSRFNALIVAAALSFSAGVSADDTEIFFSTEHAPPNILFVMDNSGSMDTRDDAEGTGPTRMEKLQSAMTLVVNTLEGVNIGIIEFNSTPELTVPVGDLDVNESELLDAIDALVPGGATGTQAALWHGRDYLLGQLPSPTGFYSSPIVSDCQANHIILMTDGQPTVDLNAVADYEAVVGTCDPVVGDNGSRKCGKEISGHLYSEDLSSVDGINNAVTHTIGFNFSDPWLESVATAGNGSFFEVQSAAGLVDAIETIIDGIGATFAAPTAPVNSFNESRHSGELYFDQFQSSESVRWNGNIKKYKLEVLTDDVTGESETVIVDANSQPLLDVDGNISTTSQSLWSAEADGAAIPQGGFAHKLPSYTDRHWYTDYNSTDPVKVAFGDADLNTKLPIASLGAADEAERNTLVEWALGRDVERYDALVAAAATAAETAANDAAAAAAAIATDAADAADAAEAVEAAAIALEQSTGIALDNANAASAAAPGDPALLSAAIAAQVEHDSAAAAALVAIADADAARQTASNAAAASLAAAQDASLAIAAAIEANEENHYFVADSLHNTPLVASYWAKSATDESGEILFSANNMGVLHAIDPDSGEELWSYTPEEHLGNIKAYFDNEASQDHVYGLDGEFTLHTKRTDQVDYDFWVDTAWLYMTERRGGNRVYGLDVSDGLVNPTANDPFSVMWKITGGVGGTTGFSDLAQTWSKPQMVTVKFNCTDNPDDCESKELLMFSGGYNADVYDDVNLDYDAMTVPANSHGNAVYFVDPETGALAWSVGNGEHHSLDLSIDHSIPSTPQPVDTDLDGAIDLMFFTDISGDVWRVDFGSQGTDLDELHVAGGKIAELSPAGESFRFFNPIDVVASGANYSTAYFSLVTGSGMRSSPLFEEPHQNRLYTIIDRWVFQAPYRLDDDGNKVSDYRYVTDSTGAHSVITADESVLKNTSDATSTTSDDYGFFRTFQLGEKVLQPTFVTSNLIFASSYVPPDLTGGVNCNFDIGVTRLYISSLQDGQNKIPDSLSLDDYLEQGDGLLANNQIVDIGSSDGAGVLGPNGLMPLKEITADEVFRKFRRTGWVELDGY